MVSNFDHRLPAVLAELALAPLLDTVVLPADAGAAKPDARIFQLALARLHVAPGEALYIGDDADDDLAGASAAGLRVAHAARIADGEHLLAEYEK
jgi:putative hydrolase of the HAD superfamily